MPHEHPAAQSSPLSTTATLAPDRVSSSAEQAPTAPAPTTITSKLSSGIELARICSRALAGLEAHVRSPFTLSAWSDARPAPGDTDYARRFAELIDEAKLADQLGFHGFWTSEVHGVEDGYLGAQLPTLAAIAAVTSRVRLVTAVLVLPYYKPRQVVEASVIVDLLSQGRLELGVAVGGYQREFDLFGVDMRQRGRLLEHGVAMLRHGFDEGHIPDGPDGALVPVTPRPVQAHVPILIGGHTRPAIRRACSSATA